MRTVIYSNANLDENETNVDLTPTEAQAGLPDTATPSGDYTSTTPQSVHISVPTTSSTIVTIEHHDNTK